MGEILNLIESVSGGFPSYFCKYQFKPMGFEMPGDVNSLYALLEEQDHLRVHWQHPLDLCKAL